MLMELWFETSSLSIKNKQQRKGRVGKNKLIIYRVYTWVANKSYDSNHLAT